MSNCKLQTLYFAATEFEVLDEFEGESGFFIKSFLINNKLNLNDWEVTEEANRLDGPEFKGMPGIEFFNKGRRDHTVGSTYTEALRLQSPQRVAQPSHHPILPAEVRSAMRPGILHRAFMTHC